MNEVAFYGENLILCVYILSRVNLLGVVVGVSELLLMSLAKMTVKVGKAVGQAVGDAKVCYYLHYCMSSLPSLYVTTSCYYVTASLTVCHCLPHCM